MPQRPSQKIAVVPLVSEYRFTSSGSGSTVDLDLPEIAQWGPYIEAITIHHKTSGIITGISWTVALQWSFDGKTWGSEVDITSAITTADQGISNDYTTATNFGPYIRLKLKTTSASGSSAVISALAVFRFRT